jgi:hypothetical protein
MQGGVRGVQSKKLLELWKVLGYFMVIKEEKYIKGRPSKHSNAKKKNRQKNRSKID